MRVSSECVTREGVLVEDINYFRCHYEVRNTVKLRLNMPFNGY